MTWNFPKARARKKISSRREKHKQRRHKLANISDLPKMRLTETFSWQLLSWVSKVSDNFSCFFVGFLSLVLKIKSRFSFNPKTKDDFVNFSLSTNSVYNHLNHSELLLPCFIERPAICTIDCALIANVLESIYRQKYTLICTRKIVRFHNFSSPLAEFSFSKISF